MEQRAEELRAQMDQGGLPEAAMRMMLYVSSAEGSFDERSFAMLRKLRAESGAVLALQEFKDLARDQALMMRLDRQGALKALPKLLENASANGIRAAFGTMRNVLEATGPLNERGRACLEEVEVIFREAAQRARQREEQAAANDTATPSAETHAGSTATQARPRSTTVSRSSATAGTTAKPATKAAEKPASKTAAKSAPQTAPTTRKTAATSAKKTVAARSTAPRRRTTAAKRSTAK